MLRVVPLPKPKKKKRKSIGLGVFIWLNQPFALAIINNKSGLVPAHAVFGQTKEPA